uniref:Uncharacterized LOC115438252 n=1 Tax=Sphaeramia orbicularis TaxID=375764 RepID=A0A673CGN4_9TELE
ETVVLSSDLPPEGVSSAYWKYDNFTIADKDDLVSEQHPFLGRVDLNLTDYSLTIRKLTVHDSGNFTFLSLVNDEQRESVCITLQVQEVLSKQPELSTIYLDWHAVNESCTVGLQCSSPSHRSVSYNWTVKNQTQSGPTFHFVLRPQDEGTTVTCTISDSLSEKSASKTLKCGPSVKPEPKSPTFIIILGVAGGSCLIIVIITGIIAVVCHRKHKRAVMGTESVYADISDVNVNGTSSTMTPCSVYETIDNRVSRDHKDMPAPQTVYDKIQLNRVTPGVS